MAAQLHVAVLCVAAGSLSAIHHTAALPGARSYWSSSPNLAAETLTIAGSFPPTAKSDVQMCTDAVNGGCQPAADVEIWSHSIKARLPGNLSRPLWLEVSGDSPSSAKLRMAINEPDIWFTMALKNSLPVNQSAALPTGAIIRAFGRALAWEGPSGLQCIDARSRASAHSVDSTLLLTPLAGDGPTTMAEDGGSVVHVAAQNASCYEAAFSLAGVAAGRYSAVVQTGWGSSRAWVLEIEVSTTLWDASPISTYTHAINGALSASQLRGAQLKVALDPNQSH